jgi:hypothetical protein
MRRQEKATFTNPNISNTCFGPLTIRDRLLRFVGVGRPGGRRSTVKLSLESLEERGSPTNLSAVLPLIALAPDLTSATIALVPAATDLAFDGSTDTSGGLSGPAAAAQVVSAPPLGIPQPDPTVIAATTPPAASPSPADLAFQSGFPDQADGLLNSAAFSNLLDAASAFPTSPAASAASPAPQPAGAASLGAAPAPEEAAPLSVSAGGGAANYATSASSPQTQNVPQADYGSGSGFASGSGSGSGSGSSSGQPQAAATTDSGSGSSSALGFGSASGSGSSSDTTYLTSSPHLSAPGALVTFTADVVGYNGLTPTGMVTFKDGGSALGSPVPLTQGEAKLPTSGLTLGTHYITASYGGDYTYIPSTSSVLPQIVGSEQTTTTLTSSVSPTLSGQASTYTATVVGLSGDAPTGTVTFTAGPNSLGAYTLQTSGSNYSTVSIPYAFPSAGSYTVNAVYNPNAPFATSSNSLTQTVQDEQTSTTVTSSVNPTLTGQASTYTATVYGQFGDAPTGSVSFYADDMIGITTIGLSTNAQGNRIAAINYAFGSAGAHSIHAFYNHNSPFANSSASVPQTVQDEQTGTTLTPSVNPSVPEQGVTFTAQVAGLLGDVPTGSVTFTEDSNTLGTIPLTAGVASIPFGFQVLGPHTVSAHYIPLAPFAPSSNTITQTVQKPSTSTVLTSSANPSFAGQSVAFTAQIGSPFGGTPTGNVTFTDNGVYLGGATLTQDSQGAQAVLIAPNLPTGGHAISTIYNGDATFSGSLASLNQVVQTTTTTSLTTSLNPSSVTQSVTFTAEVVDPYGVAPTGTLTFMDGATALWPPIQVTQDNLGSHETFTTSSLSLGAHSITAVYSGGLYFVASTSPPLNQIVTNLPPVVANPGAQSNVVGDDVFVPIDATVSDGDALTYSAAGLPTGLNIDPGSGIITGTVAAGDDNGSPYNVTVTATDGAESASQTFAWTVAHFAISNPGDQTNAVGDSVSVTTGGSDPDGDTLTFTASNLPPGLSIDPGSGDVTGTISGPINDGVPYAVTLSASDGTHTATQTFNWTVTNVFVVNPGDQQNADGDNVILPINAGENDGTPVTVTAVGLPPGLSVNAAGNIVGTISNTADTNSPYSVTVSATDGTYSDSQTFHWTVTRLLVTNPGDQTNYDGDAVSLQISATDNLGDTLTYSATSLPSGLSINSSSGLISGNIAPTADASGPYTVTVTAIGGGASNSQTFSWNVNNPVSISPVFDQSNALGDVVSVPVSATTATGDALTYSAAGLPPGVSINSTTGVITGTIANSASITTPYNVTVTVNDGAISANANFVWTVSHLTLMNPGDQTNASGDTVSLALTVSDNLGDTLSYTATGLPPGLSINSTTGLISGVISLTADAGGPYTTTVSATGGGATASQTFTWNVARILITDPGTQNSADSDVVSLHISVTDNNPGTLMYSATALPPGLSINAATGLISGTIASTADTNSPYSVTFTASDANGHSASDTFFWSVTQLTLTSPGTALNADGDTVTLPLTASGPSGMALTYTAVGLPPGLALNPGTGVISGLLSKTADASAPYTVTVTAADGKGASASQIFTWNIDQLILDNPGDQTYAAGQTVTLALVADDNDGTAVTYSVTGLPAGIIQQGADIVGTVLASDVSAAPYNILVTVTDGLGLTKQVKFIIQVLSYTVTLKQASVTTGFLIGPGDVKTLLVKPVFISGIVSDASRIPFIKFVPTGKGADEFTVQDVVWSKLYPGYFTAVVAGRSATPASAVNAPNHSDATLEVQDTGLTKASIPVTVVVPAGINSNHEFTFAGKVGQNLIASVGSSPGVGLPVDQVEQVTFYGYYMKMPVVDQFGAALSGIYVGAAVTEGGKSINQSIKAGGIYLDPFGATIQSAPIKRPATDKAMQDLIDAWKKAPLLPIEDGELIEKTTAVEVGGQPLDPAVQGRKLTYKTNGEITIEWPDYS